MFQDDVSNNSRVKEFINLVLENFYTEAVQDFLIGHQFRKIKEDKTESVEDFLFPALKSFSKHLVRIKSFWYVQLLGEKISKESAPFDLVNSHRYLSIRMGELDRWVLLFKQHLEKARMKNQCEEIDLLAESWLKKVAVFRGKLAQELIAKN